MARSSHVRRFGSISCLCVAAAALLGAGDPGSQKVTVYTSLPSDVADRVQTNDVLNGEKLALEQAGSAAGSCAITLKRLDDSTAAAGQWEPGRVASNAHK